MLWLVFLVATSPLPTGTLTFDIDASTMPMRRQCPAVLVATDTVVTRAACLDAVQSVPPSKWRARFDEGAFVAGVIDFDVHGDYLHIDCKDRTWHEACEAAEAYCRARWDGLARVTCLAQRAAYARTFTNGESHNLALVYLNRFAPRTMVQFVAGTREDWFRHAHALKVRVAPDHATTLDVLRADAADLLVASIDDMAHVQAGSVTDAYGVTALAALPSHFANLPHTQDVPVNYVFTRVDHDADWMNVAMTLATQTRRRIGRDLPARLERAAERPVEPAPTPGPPHEPGRPPAQPAEPPARSTEPPERPSDPPSEPPAHAAPDVPVHTRRKGAKPHP